MTKRTDNAGESIQKLQAKDGEPNNESARTNENLIARATDADVESSLAMNDPSRSRSAHTTHESGFVEDLPAENAPIPEAKPKGQTKTVSK